MHHVTWGIAEANANRRDSRIVIVKVEVKMYIFSSQLRLKPISFLPPQCSRAGCFMRTARTGHVLFSPCLSYA